MTTPTETEGAIRQPVSSNEVRPNKKRKRYTPAYKLRILQEAERCTAPGELAALIRREGIYSSTLADFRKQRARGDLDTPGQSAHKTSGVQQAVVEKKLLAAERENRKLQRELERTRGLLELQKKVAELLGTALETPEE